MIWEYQTVLFEFSKDGLLSDRYVDDEEMERLLNQLGQQGWDLVSVCLLQDGLLAFLKRPEAQAMISDLSPRQDDTIPMNRPTPVRTIPTATPTSGSGTQTALRSNRSLRSPLNVDHLRDRVRQNGESGTEQESPIRDASQKNEPQSDEDRVGGIRIS